MRDCRVAIVVGLLLTACGENAQVMRELGVVRTSSTSPVVAELSFVDSGRWTVFEFSRSPAMSAWPIPFHAQIVNAGGKVLLEREVTDAPEVACEDGGKRVTWRVDTLSEPFESNFDEEGLMPIDRVLKDGERHTLRLRFSPGVKGEYQVYVLETRRIYPWHEGT